MNWFEIIKNYYNRELWTIDQVKKAVEMNKITKVQYKEIIEVDYIS